MESYKWLYNIILLNLYYLCLTSLKRLEKEKEKELGDDDNLTSIKVFERTLYSRLETSIRFHLRKPGITRTQKGYMGFDTVFNI